MTLTDLHRFTKPAVLLTASILFILITHFNLKGQSNCLNSDFSLGNFTNWEGYYGSFYYPAANKGIISTGTNPRHLIIQSPGTMDPNTCGGLGTVAPGESYSARLGNSSVGAQAEQLRYTMTVTPDNNLFIYKYAVVLQDPGHIPTHQPSFTVEVLNQSGNLIDPTCGYYYVYARQGMSGWHTCSNTSVKVIWKEWTTVGLDLSSYVGQSVTIVFTTRDCEETGHYGYAYISTSCSKLQMTVNYCPESSRAVLSAPPGFTYLWTDGSTSQSIEINGPVEGTLYGCLLTAVNGCQVTIHATLQPTKILPKFSFTPGCTGVSILFQDESTINQNTIAKWKWDFGDGSTALTGTSTPSHPFAQPGIYNVKLIATSSDECSDTLVKPVNIFARPIPSITGPDILCTGITATYSTEASMSEYNWNVSQGGTITAGASTNFITVNWHTPGNQTLSVNYSNNNGCFAESPISKNVVVNQLPSPTITGPSELCSDPKGTVYTTESAMSGYNWVISTGGTIVSGSSTDTITVIWNNLGAQVISVNYTDSKGCMAPIPSIVNVTIHPSPVPTITGLDTVWVGATYKYLTETNMSDIMWNSDSPDVTLTEDNSETVFFRSNTTGNKRLYVNYTNNYGCIAISPTLKIIKVIHPSLMELEGFSPNGDGLNDVLKFKGLEDFPGSELIIFSKSGNIIYQSSDYQNDWTGKIVTHTNEKTPALEGVYYYILRFGGTNHTIKGFIYLAY